MAVVDKHPTQVYTSSGGQGVFQERKGTEIPTVTDKKWAVETLVTDTRVWEVIAQTAKTVTLRSAKKGEVVRTNGQPLPVVYYEAVSNPDGFTITVRLRKDGTVRVADGRPLRFTDEATFRTDYAF